MKRLLFCCAALLMSCAPPQAAVGAGSPAELAPVTMPVADQAGNRMEALTQSATGWCTADSAWCVESDESAARAIDGETTIPLGTEGGVDVWPFLVRNADGSVVVGVLRRAMRMYSGGGAEARELRLYRIANGQAKDAGAMPHSGAIMIRACFDEDDQAARRDACHDQYDFATRLSLNEGVTSGRAQIMLETLATTFPGALDRNADSTERGPLEASDLVRVANQECSYRRTYIEGADGQYAPDAPLPDCSQFLEP